MRQSVRQQQIRLFHVVDQPIILKTQSSPIAKKISFQIDPQNNNLKNKL